MTSYSKHSSQDAPHWKTQGSEPYGQVFAQNMPSDKSSKMTRNAKRSAHHRIPELKPLVDSVMNQCRNNGAEIKRGLQTIKQAQMDWLNQLDQAAEYQGQMPQQDRHQHFALKEENLQLMANLNAEIKAGNELAKSYQSLQNQYNRAKAQIERRRQSVNQPTHNIRYRQSRVNTEDDGLYRPNERPTSYYRGFGDNKGNVSIGVFSEKPERQYERKPKYSYDQNIYQRQSIINTIRSDNQLRNSPKRGSKLSQVDRLKEDVAGLKKKLAAAHAEIRRLNQALICAQSEKEQYQGENTAHLKSELQKALRRISELERQGPNPMQSDMNAELMRLKAQNEELRSDTVKLLKFRDYQSASRGNGLDEQSLRQLREGRDKIAQLERIIQELSYQNERLRMDTVSPKFGIEPSYKLLETPKPGGFADMATALKYSSNERFDADLPENDVDYESKLSQYKQFLNAYKTS